MSRSGMEVMIRMRGRDPGCGIEVVIQRRGAMLEVARLAMR